jgi:hypothetical protein
MRLRPTDAVGGLEHRALSSHDHELTGSVSNGAERDGDPGSTLRPTVKRVGATTKGGKKAAAYHGPSKRFLHNHFRFQSKTLTKVCLVQWLAL